MNHPAVIILIVAVVILAAVAAYLYSRERRSRLLQEHFGPEYDRVVGQQKSVRRAEGVLQFREKARETLYGADSVWATVFDVPLTRIDPKTNKVMRQWVGHGGDSLRFGHDSTWLTDYKKGLLWRIPLKEGLEH